MCFDVVCLLHSTLLSKLLHALILNGLALGFCTLSMFSISSMYPLACNSVARLVNHLNSSKRSECWRWANCRRIIQKIQPHKHRVRVVKCCKVRPSDRARVLSLSGYPVTAAASFKRRWTSTSPKTARVRKVNGTVGAAWPSQIHMCCFHFTTLLPSSTIFDHLLPQIILGTPKLLLLRLTCLNLRHD